MRFSIAIIVAILIAGSVRTQAKSNTGEKDVFVVKTEKKFIGAQVQVFNASGELLATQTLKSRKVVIDFGNVKTGSYTIRLSKDKKTKEFHYEKM